MRGAPTSYGAPRAYFVRRASLWGAAAIGLATLGTACFTRVGDPNNPSPEGRPCATDRDCPQPTDPCQVWTCWQQVCTGVAAAKDTLLPRESQVGGDCKVLVCDGQGKSMGLPDKADVPPEDDNPCADEVCEEGAPAFPPVEAGAACGKNGVCNGKGKCGVCLPEDQRCKDNKPETCSEEGQWSSEGPCPAGQPICFEVRCIGIAEVALGGGFSCGLLENGRVRCFGSPDGNKLGQGGAGLVTGLRDARQVVAGATHTCALLADRTVACWGSNAVQQLGDDTKDARGYPLKVPKLEGAKALAAGQLFSCALLESGKVSCWGDNELGQLGTGTAQKPKNTVSLSPQGAAADDRPKEVLGLTSALRLALGRDHACALLHNGTVSCWGSDATQALGRGYPPPPKTGPKGAKPPPPKPQGALPTVKGLTDAVEIAAGSDHACARHADGSVSCWGHNHHGQLGDGTTKDAKAPVKVKGLQDVVRLALGGDHSCALLSMGLVRCWGANSQGELGDPAKTDHIEIFPVPGLEDVKGLSSGDNHVCAELADGTYACWGDNTHGELGSGATGEKPSPILW